MSPSRSRAAPTHQAEWSATFTGPPFVPVMDSMHIDGSDSLDVTNNSKKSKLGYTRISIACEHCRRRKIRCVKEDDALEKCNNCNKLGKDCNFKTVDASLAADYKAKAKKVTSSGASSAFQHSPTAPVPDLYDDSSQAHQPTYPNGSVSMVEGSRYGQGFQSADYTRPTGPGSEGLQSHNWQTNPMDGYGVAQFHPEWHGSEQSHSPSFVGAPHTIQAHHYPYVGRVPPTSHPGGSWASQDTTMAPNYAPPLPHSQNYSQNAQHENFHTHLEQRLTTLHSSQTLSPQQYYGPLLGTPVSPSIDGQHAPWHMEQQQLLPSQKQAPRPRATALAPYLATTSRHDSLATTNWSRGASYSSTQDHTALGHGQALSQRAKKEKKDRPG